MHTTETYRLNQWEPSDRILMRDFNRDNQTLETALLGLSAQIAQQATQAALEAARQEAAAAVAAAKQEAAAAVAAAKREAAAAVAAVPYVKLMDITTSAAANRVDLDMSGIDLTKYAEVTILPQLAASGGELIRVRCNNIAEGVYYTTSGNANTFLLAFDPANTTVLRMHPFRGAVALWYTHLYTAGVGGSSGAARMAANRLQAGALTSLNFYGADGGAIAKGGKFTVYGVKR